MPEPDFDASVYVLNARTYVDEHGDVCFEELSDYHSRPLLGEWKPIRGEDGNELEASVFRYRSEDGKTWRKEEP